MANLSRASFGMQCFWGAEALFGSLIGVQTTRVGYAGGSTPAPTYRNLADHIETVDIEFNGSLISYEKLLDTFFKSHDPTLKHKRQYISAIFYHDESQQELAKKWIQQNGSQFGSAIVTELLQYSTFHNAEDYHQKYFLRKNKSLFKELKLDDAQVITSPIATQLNGLCAGFGSVEQLLELNLSKESTQLLKNLIKDGPNLYECGI